MTNEHARVEWKQEGRQDRDMLKMKMGQRGIGEGAKESVTRS